MSSEPVTRGVFERGVWDQAEKLSVAGLLAIPVIFATVPAILFRVVAEREGFNAEAAAAVFRAFAFAYLAFPLGYLVARGFRVGVVVRILIAVLVAALALRLAAPLAFVAALLALGLAAAAWEAAARLRGRRGRVLAQAQGVWRSRHRWWTRSWWLEAAPVIPLVLLLVLIVTGAFLLDSAERHAKGYGKIFALSHQIVAFDLALGTPGGQPGRTDSTMVSYAQLPGDSARTELKRRMECVAGYYAAAVDSFLALDSLRANPAGRRDTVAQPAAGRDSARRLPNSVRRDRGPDTAAAARPPFSRPGAFLRQPLRGAQPGYSARGDTGRTFTAIAPPRTAARPQPMPRDSCLPWPAGLAGLPLDTLGSRIHRAGGLLDSLVGRAATAPDPLSQSVDALRLQAAEQVRNVLGDKRPIEEVAQSAVERFDKAELLSSRLQNVRAFETRVVRRGADSVRLSISAHQEKRLAEARSGLAESYERLRATYLRLFAAAMAILVAGLWIARWWRPRHRQAAGAARTARDTPDAIKSGTGPPSREEVLADTYLLGIALVLLLGLPLLPKLDPANLDPRHPGRMFVQPGWYLPSFVAQQASPIQETPPLGRPGGGQVVYIDRATELPPETVPRVQPSPPRPGDSAVPSDTAVVRRLDSILEVMQQIATRPDAPVAPPPPTPDVGPTLNAIRADLQSIRDTLKNVNGRVRNVDSIVRPKP